MAMINKAPKPRHIHKLKLHKYSTGRKIYFCTLPDCNYKAAPALVVGKRALCNICGEPFILNEYAIRLVKPHCEGCHRSKDKKTGDIKLEIHGVIPMDNYIENRNNELNELDDLSSRLKAITESNNEEEQEEEI